LFSKLAELCVILLEICDIISQRELHDI